LPIHSSQVRRVMVVLIADLLGSGPDGVKAPTPPV